MMNIDQKLFTFYGASQEQVDDLCDLWHESVIEYSRNHGIVQVKSDPLSIEQFMMCYKLDERLKSGCLVDSDRGVQVYYHESNLQP